ncbi:MAG: crossover junction endonuclease [Candidatus Omnitrophica bacterium]|jgi:ERCC4-type nuclease|nr:crossover junction endonuclease [Candidatus Omnitrophota bacterium]
MSASAHDYARPRAATLFVDYRERAVGEILHDDHPDGDTGPFGNPARRLTHGDFELIAYEEGAHGIAPRMLATIMILERKTYADFAASFKDGRIDNIARMLAQRDSGTVSPRHDSEGPRGRFIPALIIEGPRPAARADGIPLKSIRAKIDHLMMRDGVHVIETRDPRDTAMRLRELVSGANSMLKKGGVWSRCDPAEFGSIPIERPPSEGAAAPPRSIASEPIEVTIADNTRRMYAQFPGVGPKRAREYVRAGISIAHFVERGTSAIAEATATAVTPATATRAPEIGAAYLNFAMRYARERTSKMDADILEAERGVSRGMIADCILISAAAPVRERTLLDVCEMTRVELGSLIYRGHQLGAVGHGLYDCLHYCEKDAPPAAK